MSGKPDDAAATISLADEDGVKQVIRDTLFGLW